ncbi:nicotinate-nucleotide diphosphorylase [Nocardioides turkmenicus]|uniref:nicotinate-nucleotide diphosphorylase n=1 Tax=Nocardioides turkmenicus TaxID=2711220 RepID=UPI003B97A2EF
MAGGVTAALDAVRRGMERSGKKVETDVEVQTVAQAVEALEGGACWIMLDNMSVADIEVVVKMRAEQAEASGILLEASGTVRLDIVRAIAETGVDLISVGALTHSASALDLTKHRPDEETPPDDRSRPKAFPLFRVGLRCRSRARTRAGAGGAGSGGSRRWSCSRSRSRSGRG